MKIISNIFSVHNELKVEGNLKENTQKPLNSLKSCGRECVKNGVRKKSKSFCKQIQMTSQGTEVYGAHLRQSLEGSSLVCRATEMRQKLLI